tara:strand:- start:23 stop:520 length:498 start_codon:yes stop_codon:yes gene_type:complete
MNKYKPGLLREKYRRGVGMMIINKNKEIFIGQRFEKDKSAWQMPQGGIDKGEKTIDAVIREMKEETGIKKNFKILYETKIWHYYKLPIYLQKKLWGGKFVGQKQKWFLIDFKGKDSEINIQTKKPEFKKWKWTSSKKMMELIVPFKKKLYANVVSEMVEELNKNN